jgi:hypothetical protein
LTETFWLNTNTPPATDLAKGLIYARISRLTKNFRKGTAMAEKKQVSFQEFKDSVNKKNKLHNGKAIQFAFVNKKRKG